MCLKGLLPFWALSGVKPWLSDFYGVSSNLNFNAMGIGFPSVYRVQNETFSNPGGCSAPDPPAASARPFCDGNPALPHFFLPAICHGYFPQTMYIMNKMLSFSTFIK